MRSTRVLTLLLVVLVLVPAGILGWLGIQGADRFEAEVRRRIARDLDVVGESARRLSEEFVAEEAKDADRRLEAVAARLARRMPFEPVGRALADAKVLLREPAGQAASAFEFDRLWEPAFVDLRILDASSRPVLPVPFEPDDAAPPRTDPERVFDALARDADAAAFGRGDLPAALGIWTSAASRLTEPTWKARAAVEAALLRVTWDGPGKDAEAWIADLEARFTGPVLARVGRPWVLLLLRGGPESSGARGRLQRLREEGGLAEVPLTDEERERIRNALSPEGPFSVGTAEGGRDVHRAALPGGLVLEVTRRWSRVNDGPIGLLRERWRKGLPLARGPVFFLTPTLPAFPDADRGITVAVALPRPGGGGGWALFGHRDAHRLFAEVSSSRRFTTIGVLSLVGVIGLGLLVGRSALAREREARRLKDDFLANVSHELRTPLTSVCLHADLLAEPGLPEPRRRAHAEVVRAEGARLSALVDDLLDFAALERGSRRLEPEPVDLAAAAERAIAPFQVLAADEGASLSLDLAPGELLAMADPHALGRILSNLVGNAWKHGRPSRDGGPGRLAVRVGSAEGRPVLDVVDDGPGIPANERAHLFERFRRGAAAGRTRGVGLGLALSRDLARALGGDLAVVEDPTRTVFRLTLPPVPPPPPESTREIPA